MVRWPVEPLSPPFFTTFSSPQNQESVVMAYGGGRFSSEVVSYGNEKALIRSLPGCKIINAKKDIFFISVFGVGTFGLQNSFDSPRH